MWNFTALDTSATTNRRPYFRSGVTLKASSTAKETFYPVIRAPSNFSPPPHAPSHTPRHAPHPTTPPHHAPAPHAPAPSPPQSRMQFPHGTNRRTLKNRGISTIRLQNLKHSQGNCMRNCGTPLGHHAIPLSKSHVIPPGPHSSTARKPRNINDPISNPETSSRELRAKLLRAWAAGPGRQHTNDRHARLEAAAGPAGPGRASRRRAERSSRRGRRAGGQATRRPETRRAAAHERTEQPHPRTAGHAAAGDQAGQHPQQAAPTAAAAQ